MAVKDHVVLSSDGGSVTMGRRLAFYSYGKFDVVIPEGREQQVDDDRIQNGYIARNPGQQMGRFDFGFIRQDATINLEAQTSDLELAIDSTEKRSEGDVYVERDISRAGMNGFELGRDFGLDDIVRYRVWGNYLRLPVTAGDLESSVDGGLRGVRVHVGGQVASDSEARRRANNEILGQIENEKRQRLRQVNAESDARRAAVSAESDARRADVESVRGVLTGGGERQADLVAALAGLNRQLQGGGEAPAPGLIPAYLQMNTRLWQMQEETNRALRRSDEALQAGQEANAELIKFTSELSKTNSDLLKAQSKVLKLIQLSNHGSWYLGDSYVLEANTWKILNFNRPRGTIRNCSSVVVGEGRGIRLLEKGDWEIRLRVTLPPGNTIVGTNTAIRITVMPAGGGVYFDRATTISRNSGWDETLTCSIVTSAPEPGCYVYAEAFASTKSGANDWWPSSTGSELTEFTARQISF